MSAGLFIGTIADGITKIAEFLHIIESAKSKLDRLSDMHLDAAQYSLESATRTQNSNEYNRYLLRARDKFIDAISVEEKNVRKFYAHFGLAFCNYLLSDKENMEYNLKKAYESYRNIWNSIPDEESIMDMNFDDLEDEKINKFARLFTSVLTFGTVPLISKAVQIVKMPIGEHYMNQIKAIMPLVKEIEKTGCVEPLILSPDAFDLKY